MYLTFLFWRFSCKQDFSCNWKLAPKKQPLVFFAIKDALFMYWNLYTAFFVYWENGKVIKYARGSSTAKSGYRWVKVEIFRKSQFGTIFVFQNMPTKIFLLRKKKTYLIDITMSFMKSIMAQAALSFLFCCFCVWCLRYFAWYLFCLFLPSACE